MNNLPQLKSAIAEGIARSLPAVTEQLVSKLVGAEISKRAKVLEQAVEIVDALQKEVSSRSRADQKQLDADGKVMSESFSPAAIDALNKAKKKLAEAEKPIAKALEQNDFSDLFKLVAAAGQIQSGQTDKQGGKSNT